MSSPRAFVVLSALVLTPLVCAPLGGCVDTTSQARVEPATAPPKIARRPGVSPHGVTVALASVAGAPDDINQRFAAAFAQAARTQDLATADAGKAEYFVRAYIDAAGEAGATRYSYVLDLFDRSKKRVARLTDEVAVKGAAADSWMLADDGALGALAGRSAGDLADALTNTPEAVAAAAGASAGTTVAAAGGARAGTSVAARSEPAGGGQKLGLAAAR